MEQKPVNQEVDLLKVLAKIYRILRKNLVLVILCPTVGLLLGLLFINVSSLPLLSSNSARSSLLLASDLLTENEANFLCADITAADSLPGLTMEDKSRITSIEYEVRKEAVTREKTEVFIKISASFTNTSALPKLQNALLTYLSNSEPIVSRWRSKEKFYHVVVKKIDLELEQLEALKSDKQLIDKAGVHSRIADLFERRVNYHITSESHPIRLVKGFSSIIKNEGISNPKFPYLLLGFAGGVLVLFLILFIRYFNAYYKQFEQGQAR